MSNDYVIVTDSTANLPEDMIEKYGLEILSLNYYVDGEEYKGYIKGQKTDLAHFYSMMRQKKEITTSLVTVGDAMDMLEEIVKQGKDYLYVGFSSGLSGTFQAVSLVTNSLSQKYPDRKLYAVDSLAAALGEGLLVKYVIDNKEKGMSISENADWIIAHRNNICHWFTVDDLFFLKRGGRISATTAVVGTALSIKPVLHVDDNGHLIPMENARGRKKSLDALMKHMKSSIIVPDGQSVYISHGDCIEDAEYVAKKVRENFNIGEVVIRMLDPVIASHSGPGTVALFFYGEHK